MNSCIRMTAGLILKHSGRHPAIVAATAECPMFILMIVQTSADRSVLTDVFCYFYRLHRRYLHNKTLALLSSSYVLCVVQNHYRGVDKFLARPGRKQATATEDFDVQMFYL
jgi:hypothetical protein